GHLYNDNFTDNGTSRVSAHGQPQLQDNFSISMWVNPDEAMPQFSSMLSSGRAVSNDVAGGWEKKFQIDIYNNDNLTDPKFRFRTMWGNSKETIQDTENVVMHKWYHLTAVKYDNGTAAFYKNGRLIGTENLFHTDWFMLRLGINRLSNLLWKGYIDEVKVYGKSLDETQICNLYKNDGPNNTGATCP
ncbi:MAG: LamG domain-containing protein, partial [bacterium]